MIKVRDLAYVTYRVTDLEVMKNFLLDFGLKLMQQTDNKLYMRGANGSSYHYVAERSEQSGFAGFAFEAQSYSDLEQLITTGLADEILPIDGPGGGHRVRLTHPDGYLMDVIHGIEGSEEESIGSPMYHNYGTEKVRLNASQRPSKGIAQVLRLGHCALTVSDALASADWLNKTLGFVASDYLVLPEDPSVVLGVFMRCDQGPDYVDHHTLFVSQSKDIHIHHCSFEVQDFDTLMIGHDHLLKHGYDLEVGVGRHMAGSQIFDYWIDPYGQRIEHYADGDLANNEFEAGKIAGTPEGVTQWGPIPPDKFFE